MIAQEKNVAMMVVEDFVELVLKTMFVLMEFVIVILIAQEKNAVMMDAEEVAEHVQEMMNFVLMEFVLHAHLTVKEKNAVMMDAEEVAEYVKKENLVLVEFVFKRQV
mgnify:CR=1 FL=1